MRDHLAPLFLQMAETHTAAFAPGTLLNRSRQAKYYNRSCFHMTCPHLSPLVIHVLLYTQFLANAFKNITTIKNYLSGAKTFVTQAAGDPSSFTSPLIANMVRGVAHISMHIPEQALPIPLQALKTACDLLAAMGPEANVAQTAVLYGFASLLRQSNLLPSSASTQSHTITRADVIDEGAVIWININSSKTICDALIA